MNLVVCLMLLSAASRGEKTTSDLDVLRAVAALADENAAKFPFGSIEFRHQYGTAGNLDDAIQGRVLKPHEARCRFLFADQHAYYEQKFSLASMTATTVWSSSMNSSSSLSSFRVATNDKLTLLEDIAPMRDGSGETYGRSIKPGTFFFSSRARFPISVGYAQSDGGVLGYYIRMTFDQKYSATIDPDATIDGVKVVLLKFKGPAGEARYWVDLERGAIPVRAHYLLKLGGTIDMHNGRITQVLGRGWFPFEQTIYLKPGSSDGLSRRIIIDSASFDVPPAPKSFVMEFPSPVAIGNLADGMSYNRPQKAWDLDHLPSANSPGVIPFARPAPPSTLAERLPGERESSPRPFTMIGIGLAALIGMIAVYRRARR